MPEVNFIDPAGNRHAVQCETGRSLMRAALNAGVPGIVAECGGCMTCGTCHVHVDSEALKSLPEPTADEQAMLDILMDRDAASRLSCQIRMTQALTNMVVRVSPHNG